MQLLFRSKNGFFVLEAFNSLATTYYFYYIYFFTEQQFGFSTTQNMLLAAGWGVVYTVASLLGGRFGQRCGYLRSLKTGFVVMAVALVTASLFLESLPVQLLLFTVAIVGMAFTWPALEALVSEGETPGSLQSNLSIYNLVWAGFGALAYFSGGAMIKALSFKAMFLVPACIHVVQLLFTVALERSGAGDQLTRDHAPQRTEELSPDAELAEQQRSPVAPAVFLKMAWLGNPFGYLAVNTVVAVIPALTKRLDLSVMWAGIFCSFWLFVRTASFALLWHWKGWHYRFRWLIAAFIGMGASFVTILTVPNLAVLLCAQAVFGICLGLLYSSSLYYSMHVGDTKGEHGGVHEAMIGVGSFAGPAVSAGSLYFFPRAPMVSTGAVGVLLLCGLGALFWLRFHQPRAKSRTPEDACEEVSRTDHSQPG